MAMSRGMKLQDLWRGMYGLNAAATDNLCDFIESAIVVASFQKRDEFLARRCRIAELLYSDPLAFDSCCEDDFNDLDDDVKEENFESVPICKEKICVPKADIGDQRKSYRTIRIKLPKPTSNADEKRTSFSEPTQELVSGKKAFKNLPRPDDKPKKKFVNLSCQEEKPKKTLQDSSLKEKKTKRQLDPTCHPPRSKFNCLGTRTRPTISLGAPARCRGVRF